MSACAQKAWIEYKLLGLIGTQQYPLDIGGGQIPQTGALGGKTDETEGVIKKICELIIVTGPVTVNTNVTPVVE